MKRLILKNNVNSFLFFLLGVSLPLKDQLSTIVLIALLAMSLFLAVKERNVNWALVTPLFGISLLLFAPRVLGLFTGELDLAVKQLVRALPILLLPFLFLIQNPSNVKQQTEKFIFFGVLLALAIVFIVCNYYVLSSMVSNKESISFIFRWKYLNFNFIEPLDLHPPYVGLFVVFCIIQTLFSNYVQKKYALIVVLGLLFFLFQLMSRNAIVIAILILLWYVIQQRNRFLQVVTVVFLIAVSAIILTFSTRYLKEKFFHVETEYSTLSENNRFSRLQASWEVFKLKPIIGVGPGNDDFFRKKEFLKMGDTIAYQENYNSHNQFFEYLATYGLVGLALFLILLILVFKNIVALKNKKHLYLLIAFVLACFTESLLERSHGIKYFGLLLGLFFLSHITQKHEDNLPNGSRA